MMGNHRQEPLAYVNELINQTEVKTLERRPIMFFFFNAQNFTF